MAPESTKAAHTDTHTNSKQHSTTLAKTSHHRLGVHITPSVPSETVGAATAQRHLKTSRTTQNIKDQPRIHAQLRGLKNLYANLYR